jgi:hypothetical protein
MGRLIAGVISLAVFICGAMYWSQAEQLQTMPQQPLCPGVTCADRAVTPIDNASAVAPLKEAADKAEKKCDKGGCPCCHKGDKSKDA